MNMRPRILKKYRALAGLFAIAASGLSSLATALHANQQQEITMDNSKRDMITALEAAGPHPSLGEQARVFDRFVGTWDCDYANFKDDGTTERARGEGIFGWVLDGRAVQDIWTWTYENSNGQRELGTTVRFFDSKAGNWRIAWIDPVNLAIKILAGGAVGDRIVLEGKTDDGAQLRWSFNDIRKDSFIWRGERSRDSGKTWRLVAEYHLKRRGASAEKGTND
jgi:hypothetical protein